MTRSSTRFRMAGRATEQAHGGPPGSAIAGRGDRAPLRRPRSDAGARSPRRPGLAAELLEKTKRAAVAPIGGAGARVYG